jgi:hypothetical protein
MIDPDLERFMAKRMGAKTVEEGGPSFPTIAARHDYKSDPGGGRAYLNEKLI